MCVCGAKPRSRLRTSCWDDCTRPSSSSKNRYFRPFFLFSILPLLLSQENAVPDSAFISKPFHLLTRSAGSVLPLKTHVWPGLTQALFSSSPLSMITMTVSSVLRFHTFTFSPSAISVSVVRLSAPRHSLRCCRHQGWTVRGDVQV